MNNGKKNQYFASVGQGLKIKALYWKTEDSINGLEISLSIVLPHIAIDFLKKNYRNLRCSEYTSSIFLGSGKSSFCAF